MASEIDRRNARIGLGMGPAKGPDAAHTEVIAVSTVPPLAARTASTMTSS